MKKNFLTFIGIGLITGAMMWGLVQASGVQINRTPSITDDGTTATFIPAGPLTIGTSGAQDMFLRTAGANRWEIDGEGNGGAGSLVPTSDSALDVGSSGNRVRVVFTDEMQTTRTLTTLGVAATTFAASTSFHQMTGDGGANTLATITSGAQGQELKLQFVDGLITITDDNTHAANSVDLSAAFTSADDTILVLLHDGISWYEMTRSVN